MSLYFLGELTLDTIKYSDGVIYEGIMGGAALYAACGAAIWNDARNYLVTTIGNEYPTDLFKEICNKLKIDVSNVKKKNFPCIKLDITYDEFQEHEFIPREDSGTYDDLCPDMESVINIADNSSIHIATMPLFKQLQFVLSMENAKYISVDPSIEDIRIEYAPVWKLMLENTDFFLVSEIEIVRFLNVYYGGNKISNRLIFNFMKDFCIKNLILKLGKAGAKLYTSENEIFSINSIVDSPIDVTGAGDSFAGGFIYAVDKFHDPVYALKYATVSSGTIIRKIGVTNLCFINNKNTLNNILIFKEDYNE